MVTASMPDNQKVYSRSRNTTKSSVITFLCFFLPFLMLFEVEVIGRLFVLEIVLFCFLLSLLNKVPLLFKGIPKLILTLSAIWLLAQILSDLWLGTPFEDYTRGWAKISFLMLNFAALFLLLSTEKRILLFLLGLSIEGIINAFFINSFSFPLNIAWKMGGGLNVGLFFLIALAFWYKKRRPTKLFNQLNMLLLSGLSIISIMFNSRSMAGLFFVCVIFLGFIALPAGRVLFARINLSKIVISVGLAFFVAWGALSIYSIGAKEGWFGEEVSEKYEKQRMEQFGAWGVLLGGRTEILVSSKAIQDSPWIGHGSWAKDIKYTRLLADLLKNMSGIRVLVGESNLIPSHSHLFGAWVEAGVIGAIFWMVIIILTLRCLIKTPVITHYLVPMLTVMFFNGLWDIFFSPFGAQRRIIWAIYFVILSHMLLKKNPTIRK